MAAGDGRAGLSVPPTTLKSGGPVSCPTHQGGRHLFLTRAGQAREADDLALSHREAQIPHDADGEPFDAEPLLFADRPARLGTVLIFLELVSEHVGDQGFAVEPGDEAGVRDPRLA